MNFLLDILFPKKCLGCRKEDSYFCQDCVRNIEQGDLICPNCFEISSGGQTHHECIQQFGLDGLWSLALYQGSLKQAIKRLKYEPHLVRDLTAVLVKIVIDYWENYQPLIWQMIQEDKGKGWTVAAVPLYWWRENKRGFNQSAQIGKLLSKRLSLGYSDCLKRIRPTQSQTKLKFPDRFQNISGAFALSPNYTLYPKPYILLIDDVWTTGSTLKECCYNLKKAGAKKVWAITLAR